MSTAHLEGLHYKPRIDKELLAAHAEGLIGMSACLKGEINMAIQADQLAVFGIDAALKILKGEAPPADQTTQVDFITGPESSRKSGGAR